MTNGKSSWNTISRERIERAARIYRSNKNAAIALGITSNSFARCCRNYGIEQPHERRTREQRERKAKQ